MRWLTQDFPQPQPLPQPDFFGERARRIRKIVRVTATTPAAARVCQSMSGLVSNEFTDLEDD